jgi:hypothetical protein
MKLFFCEKIFVYLFFADFFIAFANQSRKRNSKKQNYFRAAKPANQNSK